MVTFGHSQTNLENDIFDKEKKRVKELAAKYIDLKPITVSASVCERSAGGRNDFYSEGDYWWPDPKNPKGPYIRKDGMTNPENFTAHREAMIRFSQIAGALGSAYLVTRDDAFAEKLVPHLKAWFLNEDTMMNPNLLYAQAITGRVTGRGIGIIDTIHLLEVAKAVMAIEGASVLSKVELKGIKSWFSNYLDWMTSHPYGIAERDNGNNHSVCWALQVAVFSELVGNEEQTNYARNMYKNVLLPEQMAQNGSFPLELKRTKPYGYSLFNLDVMTALCQTLSSKEENLFTYRTNDDKSVQKGIAFLYPFVKDKNNWPYAKDVMYWEEWPVRHPFLLFGGLAMENDSYIDLWSRLKVNFTTPEVVRNMPVRYPLLWLN
jgi:hypothetical protein